MKSILKINNRTTILLLIFNKTEKCKKKGCILNVFLFLGLSGVNVKKMCYTDKDCESDYENMEDKTFEFSSVNSI